MSDDVEIRPEVRTALERLAEHGRTRLASDASTILEELEADG